MDDYKLMMAKMHGEDLLRQAGQRRRAAQARRAVRNRQAVLPATRGLVTRRGHRLALAAFRMRPTTTGR
jgi:hypothetical protein